MTTIIVVSDSHGLTKDLEEIYFRHKDEAEYFIHCGDSGLDEDHPILAPYICVNGNCDYYGFSNEYLFKVEGLNILVVHGHYQKVKAKLDYLYKYAKEKNSDIVLYGHTHIPKISEYPDMLMINPGCILSNRFKGRTYAKIKLSKDTINVQHLDVVTGLKIEIFT